MSFASKIFSITNDKRCHKVVCILGIKFKFKNVQKQISNLQNKIQELTNTINDNKNKVLDCYYIPAPFGPDDNPDEEKLFKNLDKEASYNLQKILSACKKASAFRAFNINLPSIYELYSNEEITEIENSKKIKNEVINKGTYYQYLDYKLPINHFAPEVFAFYHGAHKIKNIDYIKNKSIIDAGAFVGDSMIMFKKRYPKNTVISFEPAKKIYGLLQKTVEINHLSDVITENKALSNTTDNFYIDNTLSYPYISKNKTSKECDTIKCIKLDDYVKENNLKVGLIKTDVEGFEQKLLQGAINTIKEQKPILLISIYHNYSDFFNIKPLIENLNLGYKFDFFRGIDGNSVFGDTMLICEPTLEEK